MPPISPVSALRRRLQEIERRALRYGEESTLRQDFVEAIKRFLHDAASREKDSSERIQVFLDQRLVKGRPDLRTGAVVFEVKLPEPRGKGIQEAVEQVKGYQEEFSSGYPGQRARAVGYDGKTLVLLEESGEELFRGSAHTLAPPLGRWVLELGGDVLTPDDFVQQLGPESPTANTVVPTLWTLLQEYRPRIGFIQEVYEVWQALYGVTTNLSEEAQAGLRVAARNQDLLIGDSRRDVEDYLFVVETYIALLLRLLVVRVAAERGLGRISSAAELFAERPGAAYELGQLGTYFPAIQGLFEEDVFLWPLDAARESSRVEQELNAAILDLARQVDKVRLADQPGDFLRLVYQRFLDRAARTALGEFYTEPELVRETLDAIDYNGDPAKTLADISCGSGTFLVEAIYRIIQRNPATPRERLLQDITTNIRGIDIHPFAVAMARVNYLLAVSPLLTGGPRRDPIPIPIYWADSLARLTPRREGVPGMRPPIDIPIPHLGRFTLPDPREIEWRELFNHVRDTLQLFPRGAVDMDRAWTRLWEAAPTDRYLPHQDTVRAFFTQIVERHNRERDMRWLPLLQNTLEVERLRESCDYVVGNPPWVRIHNIAPDIRARVFAEYQVGMDAGWRRGAQLGGASRAFARQIDYSLPFVERAVEFLKPGGRLGYVITSKFMHALYGNGLRKKLLNETALLALHDYSLYATSLFEDATNYPLILALQKGAPSPEHQVSVLVKGPRGDERRFTAPQVELPILPEDKESPWALVPPPVLAAFRTMQRDPATGRARPLLGETPGLQAQMGVKTGLNKVFIVKRVEPVPEEPQEVVVYAEGYYDQRTSPAERDTYRARIEKRLLRPLIRGQNIRAWQYEVKDYLIWTHDDETGKVLPDLPPKAKAYFQQHERALKARSDWRQGMPIWQVFRVNRQKLNAKVVWQELSNRLDAVPVPEHHPFEEDDPRLLIPLQTVYLIPVPEGSHPASLAILLSSGVANAFFASFAERARGAYFRHISSVVGLLPVPRLDSLAELKEGTEQDRQVGRVYGLESQELAALQEYAEFIRSAPGATPPPEEEQEAE